MTGVGVRGGVILFRGTGTAARRYLESDRSQADEYYLEAGAARAELSVVDGSGRVIGERALTPEEYAGWVDWIEPLTREPMGRARQAGDGRRGSPRFAEMVVNTPKSLSIAAALHPDVSEALDAAQQEAVAEPGPDLGQHSVTRIGSRGLQEIVPVERLETVDIAHKTSRAGDPHRHVHLQIGTRVWAGGAWRGLATGALFRQRGAIRALGTPVLAAPPRLAAVLDGHGLTLDPVTGEVAELRPFNAVMSKRASQVARNLAVFEAQWAAAHCASNTARLRATWLASSLITAVNGRSSATSPVTGSSVRPCPSSTAASRGCAASTAVPSARMAPCCRNSAAVSSPRHAPPAHTRVPICRWTCRCGSPAREVLCEMPTVSSCSTGTTSCLPRGPIRVTECRPSQDRISATASRCAASRASETSGCRAAAIDRDFGVFTTISANRGEPCRPSPA